MSKRVLSFILVLCVVVSLASSLAMAGEDTSNVEELCEDTVEESFVDFEENSKEEEIAAPVALEEVEQIPADEAVANQSTVNEQTFIRGDATDDGMVNMQDVLAIRKYILNKTKYPLTSPEGADANGDYNINMLDVLAIRKYLLNKAKYPL